MTKHIRAKNREEAWRIADSTFPTDYMKVERASAAAGYPIYWSTLEGMNAWISDLNTSLELNMEDGETVMISIDFIPEITVEKRIDSSSVRETCVRNNFYTMGTIEEYNELLDKANGDYSVDLLYRLAEDITEHSEHQTIENVMFVLEKEAVNTFFTIGE